MAAPLRRARALLLVLLGASLAAQPPLIERAPKPEVPDARALQAAGPGAQRALADRIFQLLGEDAALALQQLQTAAFGQPDVAVRYLLLREGIALCERKGDASTALVGVDVMSSVFAIDPDRDGIELFDRMRPGADAVTATTMAVAALERANRQIAAADDAAMLAWFEQALRAAVATADAPLHDFVRDQLPRLRDMNRWWRAPTDELTGQQIVERNTILASIMRGSHAYEALPFSAFRPFVTDLPRALERRFVADAPPERIADLADLARDATVRRGLLRGAQSALAHEWAEAGDDRRREIGAAMTELTARLATVPGVSALRFRHRNELDHLVYANGRWRVEDGRLVGSSEAADNFATHRYAFRDVRSIVIRGGIASPEGLNFRCMAGDVNLLLNWEVRDENHLWFRGACDARGPRALAVGREHTITMFATPGEVQVLIDGVPWWSTPGNLDGTITVYPALGSEIFVREILIDGDLTGRVKAPRGTCM